jgi:hypothetical protein
MTTEDGSVPTLSSEEVRYTIVAFIANDGLPELSISPTTMAGYDLLSAGSLAGIAESVRLTAFFETAVEPALTGIMATERAAARSRNTITIRVPLPQRRKLNGPYGNPIVG